MQFLVLVGLIGHKPCGGPARRGGAPLLDQSADRAAGASARVLQPVSAMATSSSSRSRRSTWATPAAPATASALPRVVQAVGGAVPVVVDGGIRRGTDILKAMSLGASAVLVGRPAIWGLANAGAAGVAHVLRLLRDELEIAMALTGCATLADASPALLNAGLPQSGDLSPQFPVGSHDLLQIR